MTWTTTSTSNSKMLNRKTGLQRLPGQVRSKLEIQYLQFRFNVDHRSLPYLAGTSRKASAPSPATSGPTRSSHKAPPARQEPPRPALAETLSFLLVPLDLLNRLLSTLLSPILAHVVNSVVLIGLGLLAVYFLVPFLLSRFKWGIFGSLKVLWNLARGNGTGLTWPSLPSLSSTPGNLLRGGLPSVGSICGSIYLPLICSRRRSEKDYDVGRVARALHKEGELARLGGL